MATTAPPVTSTAVAADTPATASTISPPNSGQPEHHGGRPHVRTPP